MTALLTRHRQLLRPRWTILGLPCARSLPDPVGNGTVPLAGFRVTPLPGSAAEAEDREAEQAARQALPPDRQSQPLPAQTRPGRRPQLGAHPVTSSATTRSLAKTRRRTVSPGKFTERLRFVTARAAVRDLGCCLGRRAVHPRLTACEAGDQYCEKDRRRAVPPIVVGCGSCVRPALPGTGVGSGTGLLPEVVIGGVGDLGHGTYRCRGAFRGGWGEATGGVDPLDVGRVHEPVAVAGGRRRCGQQQPYNGGGIDGDAGLDVPPRSLTCKPPAARSSWSVTASTTPPRSPRPISASPSALAPMSPSKPPTSS